MTTSISSPQQVLESMFGMKMPLANSPGAGAQTMPLSDWDFSALQQPQDDPYALAQQIADSNSHLFEPPVSSEELETRGLSRRASMNSDAYSAAQRKLTVAAGNKGTPAHIATLENLIDSIHSDFQAPYVEINKAAAVFMKDTNNALGTISKFMKAGKDGKIEFKPLAFVQEMDKVFGKYTSFTVSGTDDYWSWSPNNDTTTPLYTFKGDSKAFDFWKNKLGNDFIIKQIAGGEIQILPNLDPIRKIYSTVADLNTGWNGGDMLTQVFQSLQSSLDSQKNAVSSSVSRLVEVFRQDNSSFETMIQLLTKITEDLHRYNAGYMN
ncbi:IpaD/SipD/SspD family type III secretion system needle tip protein [Yersinia proxima]|uniref:IpaD/SipD/SspD family type III secretion system needle tip protein n=1 Tax=Yersinia proxima TaxID=2890316 RepID=UPI001D102E80|nr:IpaD/SipD/SspD family type III secretion system needle tip protein [Yersinia proxima]